MSMSMTMKLIDLRKECELKGLNTKGNKQTLLIRLKEFQQESKMISESLNEIEVKYKLEHLLFNSSVKHSDKIMKLKTLKEAHIYCKMNNLTGQFTGPIIEKYIKEKYNMIKNAYQSVS